MDVLCYSWCEDIKFNSDLWYAHHLFGVFSSRSDDFGRPSVELLSPMMACRTSLSDGVSQQMLETIFRGFYWWCTPPPLPCQATGYFQGWSDFLNKGHALRFFGAASDQDNYINYLIILLPLKCCFFSSAGPRIIKSGIHQFLVWLCFTLLWSFWLFKKKFLPYCHKDQGFQKLTV